MINSKTIFAKNEWYPRQATVLGTSTKKAMGKTKKTQESGRAVFKKSKTSSKFTKRYARKGSESQQYNFDRKAAKPEV